LGNPIADRSVEFWKTFANWLRAVKAGTIPLEKAQFQIHVFSPKAGPIAHSFNDAKTDQAARQALEAARDELWGKPPEFLKKSEVGATLRPHLDKVLATAPELVAGIIERFTLTFGSGVSRSDLERALLTKSAPENLLEHVCDKCLGWVKSKVDAALEKNDTAAITVEEFSREIGAFIGKLRFENILCDFAGNPSQAEVKLHLFRVYVRQLELIDADEESILRAINCFLRSAVNRTEWAKRGLVWEKSFDEYQNTLCSFWQNTKMQHDLDFSTEKMEKRGMRLLLECMKLRRPLEGKEVPDDFTPGSFHTLADEMSLGWHPEFKSRLSREG